MRDGDKVAVRDGTGRVLFTGTFRAGAPWVGWHRVQPDSDAPVDLGPMYRIDPLPVPSVEDSEVEPQ